MKRFLFFCGIFFLCSPALTVQGMTSITVYTAAEPGLLSRYDKAFAEMYPDITIKWVRDSGGPIVERLINERNEPQADAIFALSLSGVLSLDSDMLEPYTPKGAEHISPAMRNLSPIPTWVAMNAWGAGLCVNTNRVKSLGFTETNSWRGLTDPALKGHVVMSSPLTSSTALMIVNSWLDLMGEAEGWNYMEELDRNISQYSFSGCGPCQLAAEGKAAIGISSAMCMPLVQDNETPVELVIPKIGTGWDMEVSALVKNSLPFDHPRRRAARLLMDFSTSKTAGEISAEGRLIPARQDCLSPEAKRQQALFLPTNFEKGVRERQYTLNEWRRRFQR